MKKFRYFCALTAICFSLLSLTQCKDKPPEKPTNIFAGDNTQTSITYVNFEPDSIIPFISRFDTAFFNLDINGDNIYDIQIMNYQDWCATCSRRWTKIRCLNNSTMIALNDTINYPAVLSKNNLISDDLRWETGEFLIFYSYGAEGGISEKSGIWFNTDKNYIAIKNQRFGWICLDYRYPKLTVYDYAF